MTSYAIPPINPHQILLDASAGSLTPSGPTLVRRLSDLAGCFENKEIFEAEVSATNPIVYQVISSTVPELPRELPQSITTIFPGSCGGELYMTKGHQHPDPQGEIYFGLEGNGGIIMFDGNEKKYVEITPGKIGYIPPGWAHRSINSGETPYKFLAVYPGSAGHDYGWVLANGMGLRGFTENGKLVLKNFEI
jgi:glucose-6-phosphate isomerase